MGFNKERKPRRNTFKKMTLKLGVLDTDRYSHDELISILSDITFDLVNVNLNVKKSDIGLNGKGYIQIGLVNKFNTDEEGNCLFDVAIFNNFIETIEGMKDNETDEFLVVCRVFTNREGQITKVIGLDLITTDIA